MKFVRSWDQLENRPTIGMLTALLKGPTEINLWQGVADRAQERDINLLCFSGGIPGWPHQYEAQKNILFDLVGVQNVDGLLVWSNIFSHTLDRKELKAFCHRYSPLPVISMGLVLPQVPSIWIDMIEGMRSLLSHLIEAHGCRRIAFIQGLEVSLDAEDRYRAYIETLSDFGLAVDPDLVVPGDFRRPSGITAMERLLDERGARFDAVVAANDNMAIGALQVLQSRGIRVPEDVIVTGFDDIEETQAVLPSLTTVRAPWQELGSKSVDTLLARLTGEPLPEQIRLQTELVLRQSCGCLPYPLSMVKLSPSMDTSRSLDPFGQAAPHPSMDVDSLILKIRSWIVAKELAPDLESDWVERLVKTFLADLERDPPYGFLSGLELILRDISSGREVTEWQGFLTRMQHDLEPVLISSEQTSRAQEIWQMAFLLVGDIAYRKQLNNRLVSERQTDRLNQIIQTMSTTYDIDRLMDLLALELSDLGIRSCYLALYENKVKLLKWSRLILAGIEQVRTGRRVCVLRPALQRRCAIPGRKFKYHH